MKCHQQEGVVFSPSEGKTLPAGLAVGKTDSEVNANAS